MTRPHAGWAVPSPARHLALTAPLFTFAGPMIAGAIPALAVGLTVGGFEVTRGEAGAWIAMAAGLVYGIGWGLLLQHNISEFVAVVPGVAAGSVVASTACSGFLRRARARHARRPS